MKSKSDDQKTTIIKQTNQPTNQPTKNQTSEQRSKRINIQANEYLVHKQIGKNKTHGLSVCRFALHEQGAGHEKFSELEASRAKREQEAAKLVAAGFPLQHLPALADPHAVLVRQTVRQEPLT